MPAAAPTSLSPTSTPSLECPEYLTRYRFRRSPSADDWAGFSAQVSDSAGDVIAGLGAEWDASDGLVSEYRCVADDCYTIFFDFGGETPGSHVSFSLSSAVTTIETYFPDGEASATYAFCVEDGAIARAPTASPSEMPSPAPTVRYKAFASSLGMNGVSAADFGDAETRAFERSTAKSLGLPFRRRKGGAFPVTVTAVEDAATTRRRLEDAGVVVAFEIETQHELSSVVDTLQTSLEDGSLTTNLANGSSTFSAATVDAESLVVIPPPSVVPTSAPSDAPSSPASNARDATWFQRVSLARGTATKERS